jgi:hypothetical protein
MPAMEEVDVLLLYIGDDLSSDCFLWKAKEPIRLLEHEAAPRMLEEN